MFACLVEVIVNVLLPQTGLYKLMIYLEPENDKAEKKYVISYLLECTKPFSQRLVFQNYGDKLGIQSMKKGNYCSIAVFDQNNMADAKSILINWILSIAASYRFMA